VIFRIWKGRAESHITCRASVEPNNLSLVLEVSATQNAKLREKERVSGRPLLRSQLN
jgi:hypothetical protein